MLIAIDEEADDEHSSSPSRLSHTSLAPSPRKTNSCTSPRHLIFVSLVIISLVSHCAIILLRAGGDKGRHAKVSDDVLRILVDKEQSQSTAAIVFRDEELDTVTRSSLDSAQQQDDEATDIPISNNIKPINFTATPIESSGIPRRLVFTYKWNILERQEPAHFYRNVQNTIQGYTNYWNTTTTTTTPSITVSFLNDTDCDSIISTAAPQLLQHFRQEPLGSYKADICRLAALYQDGGYYFDVDMELVQPYVVGSSSDDSKISFASVLEASSRPNLFQSFLAAAPGHPIIERALETVRVFYETRRYATRGQQHVWMGPYTLKQAHDAYYADKTREQSTSVLLQEVNLEDYGLHSYATIPRRRGRGCCCNYVVQDANRTVYFYSRMVGAGAHCDFL